MAAILMTCPVTRKTVKTGQHASGRNGEERIEEGGSFRCSACGQVHAWRKADVRLSDWPGATSLN